MRDTWSRLLGATYPKTQLILFFRMASCLGTLRSDYVRWSCWGWSLVCVVLLPSWRFFIHVIKEMSWHWPLLAWPLHDVSSLLSLSSTTLADCKCIISLFLGSPVLSFFLVMLLVPCPFRTGIFPLSWFGDSFSIMIGLLQFILYMFNIA